MLKLVFYILFRQGIYTMMQNKRDNSLKMPLTSHLFYALIQNSHTKPPPLGNIFLLTSSCSRRSCQRPPTGSTSLCCRRTARSGAGGSATAGGWATGTREQIYKDHKRSKIKFKNVREIIKTRGRVLINNLSCVLSTKVRI